MAVREGDKNSTPATKHVATRAVNFMCSILAAHPSLASPMICPKSDKVGASCSETGAVRHYSPLSGPVDVFLVHRYGVQSPGSPRRRGINGYVCLSCVT